MKCNILFKTISSFSLQFGYAFIILILVYSALIQFNSSKSLKNIDTQLYQLILDIPDAKDKKHMDILMANYSNIINEPIFYNLYLTFKDNESFTELQNVRSIGEFKDHIEKILLIIDLFQSNLYHSQMALMLSFIGISIILAIIITTSEFDQIKKYEKEKFQRLTDQKLMSVLENERNKIAIELHDDIAQKLSVISQHFQSDSISVHSDLLKRYNSDVIHKIRTLAQSLRAPEMDDYSIQQQIEFLYSDFRSLSNIKLHEKFNGLRALKLEDDQVLHLYRIIQELLSNCYKHSKAENVYISMLYVHPFFKITYKDDGIGYKEINDRNKLGLSGIRYRLRLLNAKVLINSSDGVNISINIEVNT